MKIPAEIVSYIKEKHPKFDKEVSSGEDNYVVIGYNSSVKYCIASIIKNYGEDKGLVEIPVSTCNTFTTEDNPVIDIRHCSKKDQFNLINKINKNGLKGVVVLADDQSSLIEPIRYGFTFVFSENITEEDVSEISKILTKDESLNQAEVEEIAQYVNLILDGDFLSIYNRKNLIDGPRLKDLTRSIFLKVASGEFPSSNISRISKMCSPSTFTKVFLSTINEEVNSAQDMEQKKDLIPIVDSILKSYSYFDAWESIKLSLAKITLNISLLSNTIQVPTLSGEPLSKISHNVRKKSFYEKATKKPGTPTKEEKQFNPIPINKLALYLGADIVGVISDAR